MKKFLKGSIIAALCLTMLFSLTACNKFNSVKKAFEKEGYTYSDEENSSLSSLQASFEDEDGKGASVTVHVFTKKDGVLGEQSVLFAVLEFKSTKELNQELEDNETLKGMLKDSQKSDYVNGNCIFVPILGLPTPMQTARDIFKNA